ncbi:hypothetical protein [Microbacterium hominis]|uniref:hypothetical protein n=1 Tax=Microbacterium hominis TaxID=162426 RepID=UPI0012E01FB0|nr:hypothetical protein [Microbacterium hominis]
MDNSVTGEEAKSIAQATELDIAAAIPSTMVARIEQAPTGVLMSCATKEYYHWAGGTKAFLKPDTDPAKAITAISDSFLKRPGFTMRILQDDDTGPSVAITGPGDSSYAAVIFHRDSLIRIASFSPCFRLSDGQSPFDEF